MIYFDNSATTYPKPLYVRQKMAEALKDFGANPGRGGFPMSLKTAEEIYRVREKAASIFGAAQPEHVIFQPGCTQALNLVIRALKRGDHVITTDLEHNAVLRPLKDMEKEGVIHTAVSVTPGDNDKTLDAFRSAIRENTKLFIVTHASNVWGIRVPIERLAALAHVYGIEICVDAAQSAGVLPLRIEENGLDYVCFAGHKGLYGPMGTGMLITKHGDKLKSLIHGGTGTFALDPAQPKDIPEGFESGTQNVPGIIALGAGLDFVKTKGIDTIRQHEFRVLSRLYDGLSKTENIVLYTTRPGDPYFAPVLSFNVRGMESEAVGAALGEKGVAVRCGLHCAPGAHRKMNTVETFGGAVRLSPSVWTTPQDAEKALSVIRSVCSTKNSSLSINSLHQRFRRER